MDGPIFLKSPEKRKIVDETYWNKRRKLEMDVYLNVRLPDNKGSSFGTNHRFRRFWRHTGTPKRVPFIWRKFINREHVLFDTSLKIKFFSRLHLLWTSCKSEL